jgi:hypothetical protein
MTAPNSSRPHQHDIGDYGERFVAFNLPNSWVVHAYKGNEDYGLDFHVEIFSGGIPTGMEFGVQVKATEKKLATVASCRVKKNTLSYLLVKPYPTIIVAVSSLEKCAKYVWIQESMSSSKLLAALSDSADDVRIPFKRSYDFPGSEEQIMEFIGRRTRQINEWLATASHMQVVANIYMDIHSALDALIECIATLNDSNLTEDELSHKITFSFTLTVMAYGCLLAVTTRDRIRTLGPISATMEALRRRYRATLVKMVSEDDLTDYESGGKTQGHSNLLLMSARFSAFGPMLPTFVRVLRDILRTIAPLIVPNRDFTKKMSGLATSIVEYNLRDRTNA